MTASNHTTYCVYRIVCFATGKVYVGQTSNPKNRKLQHFGRLRRGEHHSPLLQRAYNKYGERAFYFEVVEGGISPEDIDSRELYWIERFNSHKDGYNILLGGSDAAPANKRPCTWNGVTYASVSECARANGVTETAMRIRIEAGYISDEDMKLRRKRIIWDGVAYPSIHSASKATNISASTLKKYLAAGITRPADIPKNPTSSKPCVWNGIAYTSQIEAARALGISQATMNQRVLKGWTCDEDVQKSREALNRRIAEGVKRSLSRKKRES